nr:LacI family transcriptional regulator [Actinomycetales bacterium]
ENIRGAEMAAEEAGYTLIVVDSRESSAREQQAIAKIIDGAEGLILTSPRMSSAGILGIAKQRPVVVLNREVGGLPSVLTNGGRGAGLSAEHLANLGHDEITYVAGPKASWADGGRWRGLEEAAASLDVTVRRIGPNSPTLAGGARAASRWLEHPSTGVIAFNDMMAIGFMRQIGVEGFEVPRDVSVIGFDNSRTALLVDPGLTSVASPLAQQGAAAVKTLLAAVGGLRLPEKPLYLPVRLVERGTTARARSNR